MHQPRQDEVWVGILAESDGFSFLFCLLVFPSSFFLSSGLFWEGYCGYCGYCPRILWRHRAHFLRHRECFCDLVNHFLTLPLSDGERSTNREMRIRPIWRLE